MDFALQGRPKQKMERRQERNGTSGGTMSSTNRNPYTLGRMMNDEGSNGTAMSSNYGYHHGRIGSSSSGKSSGYDSDQRMSNHGEGSDGYLNPKMTRATSDLRMSNHGEGSDGYLNPKMTRATSDLEMNRDGNLTDRHGYLIFDHMNQPAINARPDIPRRGSGSSKNPDYHAIPENRKLPKRQQCFRISMVLVVILSITTVAALTFVVLTLTGIVGEQTDVTEDGCGEVTSLSCPRSVAFTAGTPGSVSCSIQYPGPSPDDLFISAVMEETGIGNNNEVHEYITATKLPIDKEITNEYNDGNHKTSVRRTANSVVEFTLSISTVKCCDSGVLILNISKHVILNIEVTVKVDAPCTKDQDLNWNVTDTLQCSVCTCDRGLQSATWQYRKFETDLGSKLEDKKNSRFSVLNTTDTNTGVSTYELRINRTYCNDDGFYYLILNGTSMIQHVIRASVKGVTQKTTISKTEPLLLTRVTAQTTACIVEPLSAFTGPYLVNVAALYNVSNSTSEQTFNLSMDGDFRYLGSAMNNETVDVHLVSGLLMTTLTFKPLQCEHWGVYTISTDGVIRSNITVNVDDNDILSAPDFVQVKENTGYVEGYNITMRADAHVGCKQRPMTLTPEVENATLTYTIKDLNNDQIGDAYFATLVWTTNNISMSLNGTQAICTVDNNPKYNSTLDIYVIPGTFCDNRPLNCEYLYPYKMESTCHLWVSCLNDRPRVKPCGRNLYYHMGADCSGTCEYTCQP